MRSWIVAIALSLVVAPALAQTSPAPAPLPEGAIAIAADQSGQTIEAAVGGSIAIQLRSQPSIGSNWFLASKPDFLADPTQFSAPTVVSMGAPLVGGQRRQVFVFGVSKAGSGEVILERRDRSRAVLEAFTVTIVAL
jgi:hypothetical protein